jgi:ketosteroid isomerase-like protein
VLSAILERVRAASPDVVDYLQHGFTCWNRRAIDEMMDMYTPDAEVDLSRLLPDESVLRGRTQISEYYDRMWDTWSGFGWRPKQFFELDDDEYAVVVSVDAEGRGSGTPVTAEMTIFYEVVDGLVKRAVFESGRSPQLTR